MVFTIHSLFEYILAKSLLKVVNLRGPDWQSNTSNGVLQVLHVIYTWRNMELICFVFQIVKSVKEEVEAEVCNDATCL